MQVAASSILSGIVKHYLVLQHNPASQQHCRLLPDGNTGFVFPRNSSGFAYGPVTIYQPVTTAGSAMLVAVLQPYGLYNLLGIPPAALTNQCISLTELFGSAASMLEEQVNEAADAAGSITRIEQFIRNRLQPQQHAAAVALAAVHFIKQQDAVNSIAPLLQYLHITERQLQRYFEATIGINPLRFANIIRLQKFLKLLRNNQGRETLTQLAAEAGYYDQAHLVREFKKFCGLTPTAYLQQTQPLALNFLRLQTTAQ